MSNVGNATSTRKISRKGSSPSYNDGTAKAPMKRKQTMQSGNDSIQRTLTEKGRQSARSKVSNVMLGGVLG